MLRRSRGQVIDFQWLKFTVASPCLDNANSAALRPHLRLIIIIIISLLSASPTTTPQSQADQQFSLNIHLTVLGARTLTSPNDISGTCSSHAKNGGVATKTPWPAPAQLLPSKTPLGSSQAASNVTPRSWFPHLVMLVGLKRWAG